MDRRNDWHNDPLDDAPEHIRQRLQNRGRAARRRVTGIAAALTMLAAGAALFAEHGAGTRLSSPPLPAPHSPDVATAPAEHSALPPPVAAPATAEPTLTSAPLPPSLDECLPAGSSTLDDQVARCRYGSAARSTPAPTSDAPAQGLVSAEYLARYRAERDNRESRASSSASVERTAEWVRRDDGTRYLAEWEVRDNRIDYGSVCQNHRRGSIEYRECRKAAKEWYRAECRGWEQDRKPGSQRMQERYCSAANGFSPMG